MDNLKPCENSLWVVACLQNRLFAFRSEKVQMVIPLPEIFKIPKVPPQIHGVINLRGKVIPLIDMRVRLGMPSYKNELNEFCTKREQDHKNWLLELENSVKEQRPFKLTTDPRQCAFGKWYYSFHTNDIILSQLVKKFEIPHQNIHAVAHKVIARSQSGDYAGAMKMIDECRNNELATLIKLFAELRYTLVDRSREVAIVLCSETGSFAVTVDSIDSACQFAEGSIEEIKGITFYEKELAETIGRTQKDNKMVIIINEEKILNWEEMGRIDQESASCKL